MTSAVVPSAGAVCQQMLITFLLDLKLLRLWVYRLESVCVFLRWCRKLEFDADFLFDKAIFSHFVDM